MIGVRDLEIVEQGLPPELASGVGYILCLPYSGVKIYIGEGVGLTFFCQVC